MEHINALTYINRLGDVYYFRKTPGGRGGEQVVASRKQTGDALNSLPRGMEIAETPNGKVFCRKKQKSRILSSEIRAIKAWMPKLKKQACLAVELKPDAIIVHSAPLPRFPAALTDVVLPQILRKMQPEERAAAKRFIAKRDAAWTEKMLHYEPMVKFELDDPELRIYSLFRMCDMGFREKWMLLSTGTLEDLAAKIMPHLELESFFDLI